MIELSKNHGQTECKSFTKSYHSYLGYYFALTQCEKKKENKITKAEKPKSRKTQKCPTNSTIRKKT